MINNVSINTILFTVAGACIFISIIFILTVWIICNTFKTTTGSLENILKGPTLPIVTVIVIVFAITLLSVLGILKENSITAIFGGIVGYVLGGVSKKETNGSRQNI